MATHVSHWRGDGFNRLEELDAAAVMGDSLLCSSPLNSIAVCEG